MAPLLSLAASGLVLFSKREQNIRDREYIAVGYLKPAAAASAAEAAASPTSSSEAS